MANITLVDDDENIVASVSLALESHGHKITAYHDGASGLAALESSPPDLAILDVKMPRMDGMEVLRRLRQTSQIPVIMLTSKDEEIDEILGFNLGADDYIHKPFSQRLLIERVKALLRRTGADGGEPESAAEVSGRAIKRGKLSMDPARHESTWDGKPVKLTVTEFLLLQAGGTALAATFFFRSSGAPSVRMVRELNSMVSGSSVSLVTREAMARRSRSCSSAVSMACLRSSVAISSVHDDGALLRT